MLYASRFPMMARRVRYARANSEVDATVGWGRLWVGLGLLVIAGCDQGGGLVTGDWLEVPGCDGPGTARRFEPFRLALDTMGAEREGDVLVMRFAPDGGVPFDSDQMVVILDGYAAARAEIADTGSTTWALGGAPSLVPGSPQAQAGLALLGRCAYTPTPLSASGSATFSRLGDKRGQRVVGELRFDVVDERDGTTRGTGFVATFDFDVEIGQPYRSYSPHEL